MMTSPTGSPFENNYTRPMPDPNVVFSQPGYYTPRIRMRPMAVVSLVSGVLGLLFLPLLPLAIVTGFLGMRATKNHVQPGYGAALAGTCLGFVGILLWAMIITATLIS